MEERASEEREGGEGREESEIGQSGLPSFGTGRDRSLTLTFLVEVLMIVNLEGWI
jgi:hypothetical protein